MFKMTVKSVLLRRQGLRPRARASTCPPPCYATGIFTKEHFAFLQSDLLLFNLIY